jgi:protein TonB
MGVMLGVAACAHAAIASALPWRGASSPATRYGPVELLDVSLLPPPPPVGTPVEPAHDAASVATPRSSVRRAAPTTAAPAKAAAVITQAGGPSDVLDLTDSFVTGSASTVAGGIAAAQGPSPGAVRASPGPPNPTSSVLSSPDRSRRPALADGLAWACPFPTEADAAGIDEAVVSIRVDVDRLGAVRNVSVRNDPGHGFGGAAQRCAMARRWTPAVDRDGSPVDGTVDLRVRFVR